MTDGLTFTHGLVTADGHDVGGDVLTMIGEPAGFWHCCDNDEGRAVWFEWLPDDEPVPNPVDGDERVLTGRWVIGTPPAPYPREDIAP